MLRWREGEVSYAELAMDLEATSGGALPARPEHACGWLCFHCKCEQWSYGRRPGHSSRTCWWATSCLRRSPPGATP